MIDLRKSNAHHLPTNRKEEYRIVSAQNHPSPRPREIYHDPYDSTVLTFENLSRLVFLAYIFPTSRQGVGWLMHTKYYTFVAPWSDPVLYFGTLGFWELLSLNYRSRTFARADRMGEYGNSSTLIALTGVCGRSCHA